MTALKRRHRTYVRPDEIKMRERLPQPQEAVYFRIIGQKSYFVGIYDAAQRCFVDGRGEVLRKEVYVQGWRPRNEFLGAPPPQEGDRRFVAHWLIEDGGDPVNGVDPDKCKWGQQVYPSLPRALAIANARDMNNEGYVIEEVYMKTDSGAIWGSDAHYDGYGERL